MELEVQDAAAACLSAAVDGGRDKELPEAEKVVGLLMNFN